MRFLLGVAVGMVVVPLARIIIDAYQRRHDQHLNVLSTERRQMMCRE